jgi:hypothetical protein
MDKVKLYDLAKTIRSKNGKVDLVTFDIIFKDEKSWEIAKNSKVFTKENIARLFNIPQERIYSFVYFEEGKLIKFSIKRKHPCGGPGDTDILGAQWYGPLLDLEIPLP